MRVGLNSGEVVVRAIGSDLHMDYTAVGQTTHLAARMEQIADPGAIFLTPDTLALAEGFVQVASRGATAVKGLARPIEIFELTGADVMRSRLHTAIARGLTRFVGRDSEIDQMQRAVDQVKQGRGQMVAVVGEPGVGKSRLLFEFTHSHRLEGWAVLEAGSASYGKATSYLPVVDLLKRYFRVNDRDANRDIREKVIGKILALDRTLDATLPALLTLLDVPVDDPQWQALDARQRRQRTLDAVKHLLLREAHAQPTLVIFEDLHWIDGETQSLLDSVVESLPTARLLLLVNYRPEYRHGWGSKTYYRQLRIDPLLLESADDLLTSLLGSEPGLQPLKRLLIERTEGNPLFLEESVRTLVETAVLSGTRGSYRVAQAAYTFQIPATAQAILASRIDRLSPEDKALLQAASVIGKDVPFVVLQRIAEAAEEALRLALNRLQAAEFLYEAILFPELEYTFKHSLTHEVAYRSLLKERRRALHVRIVEVIEALYSERRAEQVERLAHHALRGEVWPKAVAYLHQAGVKAAGRSAHREAIAFFEQALVALQHLPESRETIEQAIDLRFDLRSSLYPLAELGRILDYLRESETMAEALGDQRRLGKVADYLAHYFWWSGEPERAIESGERALAIAAALGDFGLKAAATFYQGRAYLTLGEFARAGDHFRCSSWKAAFSLNVCRSLSGLPRLLSLGPCRAW
jgi:predicted ATPase